ncbi:MAG: hypothetical protein NTU83_09005 [Candidatus Hydrogenedentes bacterium]|nr:hypothetical protein [Candidatus Hydrogenedentota bacterium]
MKKTYIVGVREVHARHYSVQAENEEEAKDLVDRRAELDRDTWSVEEVPDKDDSPGQQQKDAQS